MTLEEYNQLSYNNEHYAGTHSEKPACACSHNLHAAQNE